MKTVEMYKEAKYIEVPEDKVYAYIEKGFKKCEIAKPAPSQGKKANVVKSESQEDNTAK